MPTKDVLVDSPAVDHRKVEDPSNEEKLSQRFEAFKEETARMNRAYWASVRRGEERSKEIRASYTAVYQCPQCGLFRPADHSGCTDLQPADLTMEERIHRKDYPSDYNWDYELTA
jgi:hypothetical protein